MTNTDLNHRVSKTNITRSIVEGVEVPALCGELVLCHHQGAAAMAGCETGSTKLEVCSDCDELYDIIGQRDALNDQYRQRRAQMDEQRRERELLQELDTSLQRVTI